MSSRVNVSRKIDPTNDLLCFKFSPRFSLIKFCWRIPKPPLKIANNAAKEIIFNPPSCISTIKTNWPLKLSTTETSTKLNPVTQLADILVNSAVIKSRCPDPAVISGSINNNVPRTIRNKKLTTNKDGALKLLLGRNSPTRPNSKPTITRT